MNTTKEEIKTKKHKSKLKNFKNLGFLIAVFIFSLFIFNLKDASASFTVSRPPTLTTGLVGYWTFDGSDVTDKVYDKSGQGNHGYFYNGATTTAKVPGKIGQALKFDGVDDYVDMGTSNNITAISNNLTVSYWAYYKDISGESGGIENDVAGGPPDAWTLEVSGGEPVFYVKNSAGSQLSAGGGSITKNKWHHIVGMYENSIIKIFLDGVLKDTTNHSGDINNPANLHVFAGRYFTFNGLIDEVRIYNRALSASEVKSLYNQSASKFNKSPTNTLTTGLVGYWTFDGADTNFTTNTVADKSGNGNTGTMTNMSTSTARAPGKIGQALKFDGVNDYVQKTSTASLQITTGTWGAWIKTNSTKANQGIIDKSSVGGGGLRSYYMEVWGADLGCVVYVPTYYPLTSTGNLIKVGNWHHVVCVYDGSTLKAYIDGVFNSSLQAVGSINIDNQVFGIGRVNTDNARAFPGLIDEVRVYNRALSASEVKTLYNMGR